jgi:hypothetical protein
MISVATYGIKLVWPDSGRHAGCWGYPAHGLPRRWQSESRAGLQRT